MNLRSIIMSVTVSALSCSCSFNEPKYSCDEEINDWVKTNLIEIQGMSREEWLNSDVELCIPMYRAFTFEQRLTFWREKFREIKELPWSASELNHILLAEDFMESHHLMFTGEIPTDAQLDDVEIFLYKWADYAQSNLGWTDQTIYSIIACGERVLDTVGTISNHTQKSATLSTRTETCNCNRTSLFACGQHTACLKLTCDEKSSGCGGFLFWSCNGLCEEPSYSK